MGEGDFEMEAVGTKKTFSWDVEIWILSYDTSRNYRAFLTTDDPAKIWAEVRKGRTAIGPDDAIGIIRFENYSQMNVVNDDAANAWIIKTMSGPPPEPPDDTNIAPPVKWVMLHKVLPSRAGKQAGVLVLEWE